MFIIFMPGVWPRLRPEVREVRQRHDDDATMIPMAPRIGTIVASRPNTMTMREHRREHDERVDDVADESRSGTTELHAGAGTWTGSGATHGAGVGAGAGGGADTAEGAGASGGAGSCGSLMSCLPLVPHFRRRDRSAPEIGT